MTPDELRAQLRRYARTASMGGLTAGLLGAYELRSRMLPDEAARRALHQRYRDVWLDAMLSMFGVDLRVVRGPSPANGRARLVVSNHRSAIDIGVLLKMFGGYILSRADLANWPLIGRAARAGGTLFVDRATEMSRVAAARTIQRKLREGSNVIVFPEGTTFAGDEVREFFAGPFVAARAADADVLPVGIAYDPGSEYQEKSFLAHLAHTAERATTRVAIAVGAPLAKLPRDPKAAAVIARDAVQELVHKARLGLTQA